MFHVPDGGGKQIMTRSRSASSKPSAQKSSFRRIYPRYDPLPEKELEIRWGRTLNSDIELCAEYTTCFLKYLRAFLPAVNETHIFSPELPAEPVVLQLPQQRRCCGEDLNLLRELDVEQK